MATEAQRLIGISLTKIAQSRAHRGGVSLHKNLLVATVLQKARYIFMEEAYHMVHAGSYCPPQQTTSDFEQQTYEEDEDNLVALTPEEAGLHDSTTNETTLQEFLQPNCVKCDKENVSAAANQQQTTELTYLDLDKPLVSRERTKRRRAVTEWETEEAVLSILPKRSKQDENRPEVEEEADDSVFIDEAALFSDCVAREAAASSAENTTPTSSAMEIDRITSLVSIFTFGGLGSAENLGKLSRSMSTPDLCSAQAKESANDALQQRTFLAMTV